MRLEPDTTTRDLGSDTSSDGPTDVSDGPLWRWISESQPPLVFNYRDPRDVLVSLTHYLLASPSPNYWLMATASILKSLSTMHQRLDYLIRCTPRFLDLAFRQHLWLLFHPAVCKVSFEELVGPRGGGSAIAQAWAVLKLMDHLSVEGDPESIASTLFSNEARTFRKGQIGSWRAEFSPGNIMEFNKRFGDLLKLYGYS